MNESFFVAMELSIIKEKHYYYGNEWSMTAPLTEIGLTSAASDICTVGI